MKNTTPREREQYDPGEDERPLPWFVIMFLGAVFMWGCFYIWNSGTSLTSQYGDQRSADSLTVQVSTKIDGGQLFGAKCAACHQASGQGVAGVFPPLVGSEWVVGKDTLLVSILLKGITGELEVKGTVYKGAMPAFAQLSDEEIAAVASYLRTSWGNAASQVKPDTVKSQRTAFEAQTGPFDGSKGLDPLK